MQELLDLLQRNWRQNEKQVFLCCFTSISAKTVDVYCIFNNRPFLAISIKFSGYPKVIFANAIVSQPSKCLKFMTFREGCFVIRN